MEIVPSLLELAEKTGLLAGAALVAVLFPPLRNRVLGVGQRRDKLAALGLGLGLSIWGATLGFQVLGEHLNVRAIGVLIAAVLGGWKAGALAGLGGGLFTAFGVSPETAPWVVTASVIDGVIAGLVGERYPRSFHGWRAFVTSIAIQSLHLLFVGLGLLAVGHASRYLPAWPAHVVKLLLNAAGVTLFVTVVRLVVSREEAAVALVEARAAADTASLESLRRQLEPHFLFNALNALRATIRSNPGQARQMVSDLADLYRYVLSHPNDATLQDEFAHAVAYLAIERVRLGDDKLRVETQLDPQVAHARVPALLLQPLVENSVRHGIAAHSGPGRVRVSAKPLKAGMLEVVVEDHVSGDARAIAAGGSGIALTTLRQRLGRLYGDEATLRLEPASHGMKAVVRLPLPRTDAPEVKREVAARAVGRSAA